MKKVEKINKDYYERYWNENMIKYLEKSGGARWFDHLLELMLAKIPKSEIKSVADLGCGVGNKTAKMARHFTNAEVIGYDFAKAGIDAAKKYHKAQNLSFATDDITSSKNQKRFDLITGFDFLEHIDDWQAILRKLAKVNNRYMLFSSPTGRMRNYETHIGHFRNFKKGEVEAYMESIGYRTVKTFYAGFPFHSPILRDLTNIFYKNYAELPQAEMTKASKAMQDIWYHLFRYGSLKNKGDIFVGLFEKTDS